MWHFFRLDEITELPDRQENDGFSGSSKPGEIKSVLSVSKAEDDERTGTDEVDPSKASQDLDADKTDKNPGMDSEPPHQLSNVNDVDRNDLESPRSTNAENIDIVTNCEKPEQADAVGVSVPVEGCSGTTTRQKKELPLWRSKWKTSISRDLPGKPSSILSLA